MQEHENQNIDNTETSITILESELFAALAKAQGEFKVPVKNKTVDYTDKNGRRVFYKYADLADIIECIKDPMAKNGLSVIHLMEFQKGIFGIKTKLCHSSGESMSSFHPLPTVGSIRPQEFGSAITYARRYSLSCIVGIASDEDDDGRLANDAQSESKPKGKGNYDPKKSKPTTNIKNYAPKPETPQQRLLKLVKDRNIANDTMPEIIFRCTGEKLASKDLSHAQVDVIIDYLNMIEI